MSLNTPKQLVAAYRKYGSLKAAGRQTKTSYTKVHALYDQAMAEGLIDKLPRGRKTNAHLLTTSAGKLTVKQKPLIEGKKRALKAKSVERPNKGVSRFLFTSAQNNTKLHEGLWVNLLALSDYYDAELHVSRFAYIKNGLGARGDKKHWFEAQQGSVQYGKEFWFDERINDYISDEPLEVAPGLIWRGDYNILPTASRPLSGLETVTGRKSGIFPHVKIQMDSVPSAKHEPTKFNYTTGTVTMRNYIARKEGLKAEFHHCYGALLVEVENETGDWWCRQLNADSEGTLYDIDIAVKGGVVQTVKQIGVETIVENIKWGDVHVIQMDPRVRKAAWGKGGMLDVTHAKSQCIDDSFDMFARNHHEMDDPVTMFQRFIMRKDSVRGEMMETSAFYFEAMRPWCSTVVVNSNHDRALLRWLKDKRGQYDATNVQFWMALNKRVFDHVAETGEPPIILEEAFKEVRGAVPKGLRFLAQDESFIVCPKAGGGIECGQHGDDGANGSRGSTISYARLGRKMNKGHDHIARIIDSVYSSGCCLNMDDLPGYVHGPSSWSNSHTITYINGKRQIITMWGPDKKPWAARP